MTTAYWKGGYSGGNNNWALTDGSTTSNWASDAFGADTPLIPGATTKIHFSTLGATNQDAMVLGVT